MANEKQRITLTSVTTTPVSIDHPDNGTAVTFAADANAAAVKSALTGLDFVESANDLTVTGSTSTTPGTAQIQTVTLTNVTGAGTIGGTAITPGDSAADFQAALRLAGGNRANVVVTGNVPSLDSGTGKVIRLTATSVTGAGTYAGATVTPGDADSAVQTAIRAAGGDHANVTVDSAGSPGVPSGSPTNQAVSGNGSVSQQFDRDHSSSFDSDDGTGPGGGWQQGEWTQWDFGSGNAKVITSCRLKVSVNIAAGTIKASNTGAFGGEEVTLTSALSTSGGEGTTSFSNSTAYRYYRIELTAFASGASSIVYSCELISAGGATSGYYDIHYPVGVGDVSLPTVTGTGWSRAQQTAYVAPKANGTLTITFPVAEGNVTVLTPGGTGYSTAITTAYVAPSYSGYYDVTFTGSLEGQNLDLMTSATSGVTISAITEGLDTTRLGTALVESGNFATHNNGAATLTGWCCQLHVLGAPDASSEITVTIKHSSTGTFGGEETDLCEFDPFSGPGSQRIVSDTDTDEVKRYVRAYYDIDEGDAPQFWILPVISRRRPVE